MKDAARIPEKTDCLEPVPAADFVRAWKQDFGIETAHLFENVDAIELTRDAETGHMRFEPSILGDASFYQALRRFKWYHPVRKLEHVHAGRLASPGDLVLDIGAGVGDFARYLDQVGYIGLESDPDAVEAGQQSGRDLRPIDMATWRALDMFRPADLVTAFQVLEHVSEPQSFLTEMVACLSQDGRLVIGVPDAESYVADLPDFMLNAPPHHVTWWTEAALRELLDRAGMKVDAVTRFPVEPWEYQLWWMAKASNCLPGQKERRFGRALRWRKILSFCLSWPLQWMPPPAGANGSTLLVQASRRYP